MMKLVLKMNLLVAMLMPSLSYAGNLWQQVPLEKVPQNIQLMHPANFKVYTLEETTLRLQLFSLGSKPEDGIIITLPLPDGGTRDFRVWQCAMMPDQLGAQFPDIRTFSAEAVNNHSVTAKLDFTLYGFHAMIFDGSNTSFIDPYDNYHDGFYMVHYKRDETRPLAERMKCEVKRHDEKVTSENVPAGQVMEMEQTRLPKMAFKTVNGSQLRTYRLALACDYLYAVAATGLPTPTVAQTLSKMTTTMNRINGVYEREFSVHMNFCTNETALIFTSATGDPYYLDNNNAGFLLTDNQKECDSVIGNANYDLGHVFTTGSGGLSLQGFVCQAGFKAQSTTGGLPVTGDGFDIDYVAHEMGHLFGADHSFNNGTDGSCGGGNMNQPTAYEPGSGSTIMAYAGICSPDDIQMHSDAYFHAISHQQIYDYLTIGGGDACATKNSTGNKLVSYAPFNATYSIPYLTPFELDAPVITDSVADSANLYCWEEWDLPSASAAGERLINTHLSGPLFRSYSPTATSRRIFPKMMNVLSGTLNDAGNEGAEGEKVPDVARVMNFNCTFRDIYNNMGCITIPDDKITLNAINTGTGFKVTSQDIPGLNFTGHTAQTVTWDVVGTDAGTINCANVDIFMATDGGYDWHYHVGTFPNTGTASITMPNPGITYSTCRFKVKGVGNVFFNVNASNFTVNYDPSFPISTGVSTIASISGGVNIFPNPATSLLHFSAASLVEITVFNTLGQSVWHGQFNGQKEIPVADWARGIYYVQILDGNNERAVKRFVLE